MKRTLSIVALVTLYAFFFQASPWIGVSDEVIVNMFLFSPFLVIFMAYYILRYGKPSSHTFDDRFYDDRENDNHKPVVNERDIQD